MNNSDCGCNNPKPKCPKQFPTEVLQIVQGEKPILFHKTIFPASIGDDTTNPPNTLDYKNVLLVYEANGHSYLYSSDGAPTLISEFDAITIIERLKEMGVQIEDLETDVQGINERIGLINEDLATLDQRVENNEDAISTLDSTVNTYDTRITNAQATANVAQTTANQATSNAQGAVNVSNEALTKVTALGNDVAELQAGQTNLEDSLADIQADLANETLARSDADDQLQTQVTTLAEVTVQSDTAVSGDASTVTITKSLKHLNSVAATDTTMPLPVASETAAGVMNPATFIAVQNNSEDINSILQGAVAITGLAAEPTQEQLNAAWKDATALGVLINRASIFDVDNNKLWYYYTNTSTWYAVNANGGEVTVTQFTNDTAGIIKGSDNDGQLFAEADGTGSVVGWDGVKHDIENLTQLIAGIDIPKLPNSMVYDFVSPAGANNPSTADNANITARVVNTATGAVTNATLMMPMASTTQAGSITAADKTKLNSILTITSIGANLTLSEDGTLSATAGEGDSNDPRLTDTGASRANNLALGTLTNLDGVAVDTDNIQLEFGRQNLVTGVSTPQTAIIPAVNAAENEAGLMLPSDKTKLDALNFTGMAVTRANNLPPAVVTGFEDTTYGTETITMHLDTKDLATGGVAVQELVLNAATANTAEAGGQAGIMTAFQATQLQALAEAGITAADKAKYDAYEAKIEALETQVAALQAQLANLQPATNDQVNTAWENA